MHTIELMEEAIRLAESLGYGVRREWLGGAAGGRCEFAGKKWIFLDLSLNQLEQLDQLREALAGLQELTPDAIASSVPQTHVSAISGFLSERRAA